jgi:hypothetical protein
MKAAAEEQGITQEEAEQQFLKTMRPTRSSIALRQPKKSQTWSSMSARSRRRRQQALPCVSTVVSFGQLHRAPAFSLAQRGFGKGQTIGSLPE